MGEKVFDRDKLTKKERVLRTINHQPVDRPVIHEQLSYNTEVISHLTGRSFEDFGYTPEDVGKAIRRTLDTCFPIFEMKGTDTVTTADGFVFKNDNWTTWRVGRPFKDEKGAAEWLKKRLEAMERTDFNDHTAVNVDGKEEHIDENLFDAEKVWEEYRAYFLDLQRKVGETVIIDFSFTGFCDLFDAMGLEIFTFFSEDYPDLLKVYMDLATENELRRVRAVADNTLSPLILIPEDVATKHGPIFDPRFLDAYYFPYIKLLAEEWHKQGYVVLFHSDGDYKMIIPELIACGIDGFYCLEPACGMDIIRLKQKYPDKLWAGGIDGVHLMEKGKPEQVEREVKRQIEESNVLQEGGMFVATSSEINPGIPVENFLAMINAVGESFNPSFARESGKVEPDSR
jgi:hypothetical protein